MNFPCENSIGILRTRLLSLDWKNERYRDVAAILPAPEEVDEVLADARNDPALAPAECRPTGRMFAVGFRHGIED